MVTETLEQALLFILSLSLLLIILIKNYYYKDNIDDDVKLKRYFSKDIDNDNDNNNSNNIISKIFSLFQHNNNNNNNNDDDDSKSNSFRMSLEKFYGRVFPSSFWSRNDDDNNIDIVEPLIDINSNSNNDPLNVHNIISLQQDLLSNGKVLLLLLVLLLVLVLNSINIYRKCLKHL